MIYILFFCCSSDRALLYENIFTMWVCENKIIGSMWILVSDSPVDNHKDDIVVQGKTKG